MLSALSFNVVVPTAIDFLERLQRANRCDGAHRDLAQYLVELAMLDIRMIRHAPSHVAAAALLLSNGLLQRRPVWPASMAQHSRYGEACPRACAEEMRALLDAVPSS